MKSYKENWKKLIGIGVVALAALLVLIGIEIVYHEKVKKDAGVEKKPDGLSISCCDYQ